MRALAGLSQNRTTHEPPRLFIANDQNANAKSPANTGTALSRPRRVRMQETPQTAAIPNCQYTQPPYTY